MHFIRKGLFALSFVITLGLLAVYTSAGTTPPTTVHSFDGIAGEAGWYLSDVDVTLTATDAESGVHQITYWIDDEPPTVTEFSLGSDTLPQYINYSFEKKKGQGIKNWYGGVSGADYYQSAAVRYDQNKSAAITFLSSGSTFYYWHNEPDAVALPEGESVEINAWVRPFMFSGDIAYFEVWGERSNGSDDVYLATSSTVIGTSTGWQNVSATFTVPTGQNYIYVKLGGEGSPSAALYWDLVEIAPGGASEQSVNFNFVREGEFTLHYFSEDFNGNTEAEVTTPLKINLAVPNPWQNFFGWNSGCNHCYTTEVEVMDDNSGLDISTAEYRFYTEHGDQFWSDWIGSSSVTVVSTGLPALDGESTFVKVSTPEIDFGDSSPGPFRVQFRMCNMAGLCSDSPVYDLISPWAVTEGQGSIYIRGEISLQPSALGEPHATADVANYQYIESLSTSTGWVAHNYVHAKHGVLDIGSIIDTYDTLKQRATDLSGGAIPGVSGIYIQHGAYTLNSTTAPSSYKNASMSAVVIVEGDLSIASDIDVVNTNNTIFLIEGDLLITNKMVETIEGFYIAEGVFDTDATGVSKAPLEVYGSVVALEEYVLARDLKDNGAGSDNDTAAERFIWQPRYLLDSQLIGYLTNETRHYTWSEVDQP